jgi:hypothetical protein
VVEDPGTATGADALRPLSQPRQVEAGANQDGEPLWVQWQGRQRRVESVEDSWRIDDEWWRAEISRRYFLVALDGGRRLTLYQDLLSGEWFAQAYRERWAG